MTFPFYSLAFIDGVGTPEMVMIVIVVLVLFGGQKLPEFARGLGKSIKEFKKAAAGVEEEFKRAIEEDEIAKSTPKILPPSATQAALPVPNVPVVTDLVLTPDIVPTVADPSSATPVDAPPSIGGEVGPEISAPPAPVKPVPAVSPLPRATSNSSKRGRSDV